MARVRSKRRTQEVAPTSDNRRYAIVAVGVVLVIVVGLIAAIGLTGGSRATNTDELIQTADQSRIIGEADAPLVIKDFSDFGCPHCRDAAANLTPEIIETYVNTGQVRLEFIPVSVLGEESTFAAQAALCADDQGKFWSYHDVLFDRQGRDRFTVDNLSGYAEQVGLDRQQFRDCVLSGQHRSDVEQNNIAFRESGGTGTPTFVVGTEVVGGAVPFEQMQPVIERQLEAAGAAGAE